MVKYQLIYEGDFIFLNWIGKHTYGSCTIRGTCLHFQPSSAKFFHSFEQSSEFNVTDNCNNYINKNTDIAKNGLFLGECCSYRCYDLNEAINILNIKPIDDIINIFCNEKYMLIDTNDDNEIIYMAYKKFFNDNKNEIKKSQGYCNLKDNKITYFFKHNKIMNELKKINQYIKSNKVFQEWV